MPSPARVTRDSTVRKGEARITSDPFGVRSVAEGYLEAMFSSLLSPPFDVMYPLTNGGAFIST